MKLKEQKKFGILWLSIGAALFLAGLLLGETEYGSYIGGFVSGNGLFTFSGSILPLIVVAVSGLAMALCLYLSEKKKKVWIDSFSIAGSMLLGMAAAVLANLYL